MRNGLARWSRRGVGAGGLAKTSARSCHLTEMPVVPIRFGSVLAWS